MSQIDDIFNAIGTGSDSPGFFKQLAWALPGVLGAGLAARRTPGGVALGSLGQAISDIGEGDLQNQAKEAPLRRAAKDMWKMSPTGGQFIGPLDPAEQRYDQSMKDIISEEPQLGIHLLETEANQRAKQQAKGAGGIKDPFELFRASEITKGITSPVQQWADWQSQLAHNAAAKKAMEGGYPVNWGADMNATVMGMKLPDGRQVTPQVYKELMAQNPQMAQQIAQQAWKQVNNTRVQRAVATAGGSDMARFTNKYSVEPASMAAPKLFWVDTKKRTPLDRKYVDSNPVNKLSHAPGIVALGQDEGKAYVQGRAALDEVNAMIKDIANSRQTLPPGASFASILGKPARDYFNRVDPQRFAAFEAHALNLADQLGRLRTGGSMRSKTLFDAHKDLLEGYHDTLGSFLTKLQTFAQQVQQSMDDMTGYQVGDPPDLNQYILDRDSGETLAPPGGLSNDNPNFGSGE